MVIERPMTLTVTFMGASGKITVPSVYDPLIGRPDNLSPRHRIRKRVKEECEIRSRGARRKPGTSWGCQQHYIVNSSRTIRKPLR
jgi:hypothetical protein